jgi:hypothetical protein
MFARKAAIASVWPPAPRSRKKRTPTLMNATITRAASDPSAWT